ncbi:peptidoglycan-binding domain-containing protein [Thalassomonas actiniarum]|uniref:Peptidoglycan-binding protein n=1 Tax=Thalassomonas actiniarum TaxID=485447 RepID=A0AAF0C6U1_9GAMM|nr:peptidoglycan-binding domain-containing protein [Thalassomonas actiniarum]WDE02174.1 peptidoglycan-binding protein [Thalassomonas actiniarum]
MSDTLDIRFAVEQSLNIDKLASYQSCIRSAVDQGILLDTPGFSGAPKDKKALSPQFRPLLCTRLYRLGYLDEEDTDDISNGKLVKAIKQLQKEAGLKTDGWIGEVTWQALQQLFTFEEPTELEKWYRAGQPSMFLRRAVNLRLMVLGINRRRAQADNDDFSKDLAKFGQLLSHLGVKVGKTNEQTFLLDYLFDIDSQTRHIGSLSPEYIRAIAKKYQQVNNQSMLSYFGGLLRAELWLSGYKDAALSSRILKRKQHRMSSKKHIWFTSGINDAIQVFWKDLEQKGLITLDFNEKKSDIERFIYSMQFLAQGVEAVNTQSISKEQITQELREKSNDRQYSQHISEQWQSVGWFSWIFDGLKRIWHAIKNLLSDILETAKYLIRGMKQVISNGLFYLQRAFYVLEQGLEFLLCKTVPGSNEQLHMQRDRDFDYKVFVGEQVTREDISLFSRIVAHKRLMTRAALRVFEIITKAMEMALSLFRLSNPIGWWKLIQSLININELFDEQDKHILSQAFDPDLQLLLPSS